MSNMTYKVAIAIVALATAAAMIFVCSFENRTRRCLDDSSPGDIYLARINALHGSTEAPALYGLMRVEEVFPDRVMAHPAMDSSASKRRAYRDLESAVANGIRYDMSKDIEIARDDLASLHARGIIVVAKNPGT
jgi:hypothetical protein